MSNIDKQALNEEQIEWLNKLADMEYCKSNPGHWLMSLKDTNMLAKLALSSVSLLDELEAAEKRIAEMQALARDVKQFSEFQICHYGATEDYAKGYIDCQNNYNKVLFAAAGKGESS